MSRNSRNRALEIVPPEKQTSRGEELALATDARQGNQNARYKIADMLLNDLRRPISYIVGPADVDDLVQEALIEVLQCIGEFRGESSMKSWATKIAVRTALHFVKKERRRKNILSNPKKPLSLEPKTKTDDPEVVTEAQRIKLRIAEHLEKLSPERRIAVVLHHVEGYSIAEIAEITETTPGTVRDRLYSGRKLLRRRILADPLLKGWAERTS